MSKILNLFVYGSLKPGECNEHVLERWFVSAHPASIQGCMRLRPDGYPSLTLADSGLVRGFVVTLEPGQEALPILDEFEGCYPGQLSEYHRVSITVSTSLGLVPCWVYVTGDENPTHWPLIEVWPPNPLAQNPAPYSPRASHELSEKSEILGKIYQNE